MSRVRYIVLVLFIIFFVGCGSSDSEENSSETTWYKPSLDTTWQWQLNGSLNKNYQVDLYDVDLFDTNISTIQELHDEDKKVICYFSAGSYEDWREDASSFPSEVLGNDLDGWAGEKWLDISKLDTLAPIMKARLDLAKTKGCDGVEPDNVDGYTNNTGFDLSAEDQLNYNKFLSSEAHKRGLSIGLKNDLDQVDILEPYFDFALNEQCNYYNECDKLQPFVENNKAVFNAEYDSRYLDDTNRTTLCQYTNSMGLKTLVLPIDLNDSFRYSCDSYDDIINRFSTGFGGSNSFKFQSKNSDEKIWVNAVDLMLDSNIENNSYYQKIKDFNSTAFSNLQDILKNSRYFSLWVTKGWENSWYDISSINKAIKAGKIPLFIYWYFGDSLIDGMPSEAEIEEYQADTKRLKALLDDINGTKLVIVEPEFNKQVVLENNQSFVQIISDSLDTLKGKDIFLSLCMTDTGNRGVNQIYEKCGYENCALGDKYEWSLPKTIYEPLLDKLDFISFQQMIGQFSRDPQNPGTFDNPNPISYSDEDIGIEYLPKRLENMANYLYELYHKPIFLPYITIATATWKDTDGDNTIDSDEINSSGYEEKAAKVYRDINITALQNNHLFGYSIMELFDQPDHDKSGYQFFLDNEYHLGVIKSSAKGGEDNATFGDIELKSDILQSVFIRK